MPMQYNNKGILYRVKTVYLPVRDNIQLRQNSARLVTNSHRYVLCFLAHVLAINRYDRSSINNPSGWGKLQERQLKHDQP